MTATSATENATEVVRGTTPEAATLVATPGHTIGPFYGFALPWDGGDTLVGPHRADAVRLHGTLYDGHGIPVPDSLIEIWQAETDGTIVQNEGSLKRDGWTFTGYGRTPVDDKGHFTFTTVNPGQSVAGKPAFISFVIFARGLMNRLFTRCYLPDDAEALASDAFLNGLPEDRRKTLIGVREADGSIRFDIRLQGDGETVFLAFPGHGEPKK